MYTALMTPSLLLSVKSEEVIIELPLSTSEQHYRTHSFTHTCADNILIKSEEMILCCLRCSCTSSVREKFSITLCSEAFRSHSYFSACQSFLRNDRIEADASVTASECRRLE